MGTAPAAGGAVKGSSVGTRAGEGRGRTAWHLTPRLPKRRIGDREVVKERFVGPLAGRVSRLELGGSNNLTNLWPQPYRPAPGAREKDVLENFLHRAVCGGAMTIEEAQRQIATDWYKAYQEMKGIQP